MFCNNCGSQIEEGKNFCNNCGASVNTQTVNNNTSQNNIESNGKDNKKVYKILSYLGILWLVGLLCKDKDDPDVRFHVGQGIILTIVMAILYIVVLLINNLVIANMFKEKIWGITIGVSGTGLAIMGVLNWAVFIIGTVYEIMGIINAAKNERKELPIIGSHAFYK